MVLMTKLLPILRQKGNLTPLRNPTTCQWWQWHLQHLSPTTFFSMGYSPISSAITSGNGSNGQKLRETQKNGVGCPEGQTNSKEKLPRKWTCGKTNHPEERCWQGAGAHLKHKRTRAEDSSDSNPESTAPKARPNSTRSNFQSTSTKNDSKKLISPRLRHLYLVSVRQYVRLDPPTKVFCDYQQQLMGYPSVVRQQ